MNHDTPCMLLWRACGAPPSHKAGPLPTTTHGSDGAPLDWTRCWVCAGPTNGRGCPIAQWDGANFTGQTRVKYAAGQAICEPCLWVMARHSPVPEKTGNWRNYSVLYAAGEPLLTASKGDKPSILAWLRRPHAAPWFAALADTGQKHVVPYVPLNGGGRAVAPRALFDEVALTLPRPDDAHGWRIVDDLAALLTSGATKEEVERGEYTPHTILRCGEMVRAFEARYGHLRGGGWFALVVFLAQRDEAAVMERLARESEARRAKAGAGTTKAPRRGRKATNADDGRDGHDGRSE